MLPLANYSFFKGLDCLGSDICFAGQDLWRLCVLFFCSSGGDIIIRARLDDAGIWMECDINRRVHVGWKHLL